MATSDARGHGASSHQHALLDAAQRNDWRAMDELLRRYESLIRAIVAGVRMPCGCERDDIAQEARVGLLSAIRAWRPARGPFGAFAAQCARSQVFNALDRAGARKHQLLSRALPLDPRSRCAGSPDPDCDLFNSLYDVLPSPTRFDQPVAALLAREELDWVLAAIPAMLTCKERAALTGALNGKSHQQVAEEQGTTKKAVALALRRARRKLAAGEALAV